jgi:hypothetical protein
MGAAERWASGLKSVSGYCKCIHQLADTANVYTNTWWYRFYQVFPSQNEQFTLIMDMFDTRPLLF